MDSYFSLLNLSFVENFHISIFTMFAKQSMINRLLNPINRNRSAAKISKVMSSSNKPILGEGCAYCFETIKYCLVGKACALRLFLFIVLLGEGLGRLRGVRAPCRRRMDTLSTLRDEKEKNRNRKRRHNRHL